MRRRLLAGLEAVAVAAATVAAALPGWSQGLWLDEVLSVRTAGEPWGALLVRTGLGDVHPPGYYALLKVWMAVVGDGDGAVRALSLAAAVGTAVLLARTARRRLGGAAGLVAGALLALSTFHAHYAVEVRAYALLALLALASLRAHEAWRARPGSGGRLAALVALQIALVWTHYVGLLWVLLLALHALVAPRPQPAALERWALGQLAVLVAFAPWLPMLLAQLRALPAEVTAHLRGGPEPARLLAALGPATSHPVPWLGPLAGAGAVGIAALGAWRLGRAAPAGAGEPPRPGRGVAVALLAALLFLPALPLAALPLSDRTFEVLAGQLPLAEGLLLAAVLGLGGAVMVARKGRAGTRAARLCPPAPVAVLGAAAVVLPLLALLRPVLSLRNLLPFLPPLLLLASAALPRRGGLRVGGVLVVVALLAAPSLRRAPEAFQPRPALREAARRAEEAEAVFVLPKWDAPGVDRYLSHEEAPRGLMRPAELPSPASLPARVTVLLTRSAAGQPEPFRRGLLEQLGPRYELEGASALRGVRVLRFSRRGADGRSAPAR